VTYDETFVTLLERMLGRAAPGAEVINLGVPGSEPEQEFHLVKAYGIRFQPEVVMLNVFIGNDIILRRGSFFEQVIAVAG